MLIPYLFLGLAQAMVAVNVVGLKYLISSLPFIFILTLRFGLATLILLPLHWMKHSQKSIRSYLLQLDKRDWKFILAQALCAGVFFNFLMLLGLNYTDANVAGIIMSALPAFVAILSFWVLKEKLTLKKSISVVLATLGLLAISVSEFHTPNTKHSLLGDFIIFLALFPEASYYILTKIYAHKLPVFLTSALINAINTLLLFPIMLIHQHGHLVGLSGFQWLLLIIVSICSALFYVFWYLGSHQVDGVTASISTALMPIVTTLIAWVTLGEVVNSMELLGMGLVMTSIVAYTFS